MFSKDPLHKKPSTNALHLSQHFPLSRSKHLEFFYKVKIKFLIFCIMGGNAICTKQTNEDGRGKQKGKTHLKGTFQLCLYFGDFCKGGERTGNLYINNNKKKKEKRKEMNGF